MKLIDERRITARPIVTITVANTGSPSIGRITTRSMTRPSTIGGEDGAERNDEDIAADRGRNGPGDIGCDHGHLALREIDQAGRLVDHRKAHRDQAIDGADGEAGNQQLNEILHQPSAW